ncbi:Alpha-1,2-mannosidase [Acidisarcina polymorpha]|uniref:Alpha-1,2-mannosidase n=1 Tax=Acidisarcina polymorpha TaxID=2211140 RepID=A0A2Z5FYQ8_9BACT|nr:GH92 family glycosyl hydrolase [Acidisarcina polymorpha]AXC11942.1 Alpha-1,2-mannosidase [Acidisarcina polymorpha]
MYVVGRSIEAASLALLCATLLHSTGLAQKTSAKTPLEYANGLVGTAPLDDQKLIGNAPPPGEQLYSGFTSPAAMLPHSSTELGPINANLDLNFPAGVRAPYFYPNRTIFGFSTGAEDSPTIMPIVGDWTVPPERSASVYDKMRETSSPGFYSVYLDDYRTLAEMTATAWTGIFRFTFPQTEKAHILLDWGGGGGDIEIVNDHSLRGKSAHGNRYFVAEFSRPFRDCGAFKQIPPTGRRDSLLGDNVVDPGARTISGNFAGAYLRFATNGGEQILVKVATGLSYAMAEQRLQAEDPEWDFDRVKRQAEHAWAEKLNRIEVKGGTEKEKMLFYSCLYHSFASPRLVARKGDEFVVRGGKIEEAAYDHYGEVPFWDTGRNQIVLLTLLEPNAKLDILRSQFDMARERGYMGTSFHGDNAVFMYLGDWERGLKFDYAGVYEYLRKNATDPHGPRGYLAEYMRNGWISDIVPDGNPSPPYAGGKAGAATTLEYSWDDYALALYAKKLGRDDDYRLFLQRAHNYRNVFDPSIGFMRGKTEDGRWITPFDPKEPYYNFMMKEASGWSTLWLVPHDGQGLIDLLGGREKFAAKLDEFFNTPYTAKGICRDCTGVIGQYVQGNQPDQQSAYYYDWAGQPWKTQKLTREILASMYGSDRYGLAFPGMDDQGSTSSWYVMSALGFYPVDPSSPDYILGSPVFDQAVIHMGSGKDFTIVAHGNSARNIYIQSATLNGKPWNKPWFSHSDIADGGKLILTMGPEPNRRWGSAIDAAPPSMTVSSR